MSAYRHPLYYQMRVCQMIRRIKGDDGFAIFIGLQIRIPVNSSTYIGLIILFLFRRFVDGVIELHRSGIPLPCK